MSTTSEYRNRYDFAYWMQCKSDALARVATVFGIEYDEYGYPTWLDDCMPDDRHEWVRIANNMTDVEIKRCFEEIITFARTEWEKENAE